MRIEIKRHLDMWQEIKDSAVFTLHKDTGKYPDSDWKKRMLIAEHSPIRVGYIIINCYGVPSYVINHIVRHNVGFTPFVSSLRSDRHESETVPDRNTPNNLRFDGNFQALINISRRRLCTSADPQTRAFWGRVLAAIYEVEPELWFACVPECIYRGGCPEYPKTCGWFDKFRKRHKDVDLLDVHARYEAYALEYLGGED